VAKARIIDRVATSLGAASDDLLLVANDPAADSWLPGVRRVGDVRPGRGPLGGVHAALTHCAGSVLVVAWDMPFVAPALLHDLRRRARGGGYRAIVPESAAGQLEPTCALYAQSCRLELERWLDSGRAGAAAFLMQCPGVLRIPVAEVSRLGDPALLFFSVNTPEALTQAEAFAALS
jgi:molybdopterin-guanine dinucleotide biosynthesis protein A